MAFEIKTGQNAATSDEEVRGRIDNYEISNANLMPVGDGTMFLAVNSEIRKQMMQNEATFTRHPLLARASACRYRDFLHLPSGRTRSP